MSAVRRGRAPAELLAGRVVLVAGAREGAAAARALVDAGAAVVVVDPDARAAGSLCGELVAAGGRAAVFTGDPADPRDRDALAEMVTELFP
ncbi:MAG: hypothetical protein M5U14_17325 [Acidimicrobiia bacterium]|nr:hypothetical protein [Acidimicrobiia bacterium]